MSRTDMLRSVEDNGVTDPPATPPEVSAPAGGLADTRLRRFEAIVLPHLDAAHNLARWLTRSDDHAEDVVQTACLRALQFFDGFQGQNARAWLLTIVRNTFFNWCQQQRSRDQLAVPFEEEVHTTQPHEVAEPELELLRGADAEALGRAFAALPVPFREVIVLRELEGLSYREIAAVTEVPIGTVMSRLARARHQLQAFLLERGVRGRRS